MRKISLAIAGIALTIAAPAMAYTLVAGPFKNNGQCNRVVHFFNMAERRDDTASWGGFAKWAGSDMGCEEQPDGWYIVVY